MRHIFFLFSLLSPLIFLAYGDDGYTIEKAAESYHKIKRAEQTYNFSDVLKYTDELLKIANDVTDPEMKRLLKVFAYQEAGFAKMCQNETKNAIELFKKAYSFISDEEIFKKTEMAFLIADLLYEENDFESGDRYFFEGEKITEKLIKHPSDKLYNEKLDALKYMSFSVKQHFLIKKGNYSEVISLSKTLMMKCDPESLATHARYDCLPDFYFLLGFSYYHLKDIQNAIHFLAESIHISLDGKMYHTKAYITLVEIYIQRGAMDKANELCEQWMNAVQKFPSSKPGSKENNIRRIKLFQARICQKEGQKEKQKKLASEVLLLNPTQAQRSQAEELLKD